ncbi:ankyrin repeat-containing domain protein [Xylariaceae sp. FL1272]|nr:ankyrin repeat-containing domain protein [Xylariaceae sp. FL1272]
MAALATQDMRLEMQNDFALSHMRLHAAARDGDIDAVRNLLKGDALQQLNNAQTPWGTPLHVAIWCDNLLVARILLDAGADPTIELGGIDSAETALQLAAQRGHLDINRELRGRMTPESHANEPWSCLLQAASTDPDVKDYRGQTVLHGLAFPIFVKAGAGQRPVHDRAIELLLRHGASVSAKTSYGEIPLHLAAFTFGLDRFQLYLSTLSERGLLVFENKYGESLLHYASAGANVDVMRHLLDHGLDVSSVNRTGWTPYLYALTKTCKTRCKPQSPNVMTEEGWTPLHCVASYACSDDRDDADAVALVELAKNLIEKGARTDVRAASLVPGWEKKHPKTLADLAFHHPLL